MLQIGCCCGEGPSCEESLTCTGWEGEHIEALMCCGQRGEITVPRHIGDGQYEIVTYETSFINISHVVNGTHGGTWFDDGAPWSNDYARGITKPPSGANCRIHFKKNFNTGGGYQWEPFGLFGNWSPDDSVFNDAFGFREDLWAHYRLNSGVVTCGDLKERNTPGGASWKGTQVGCCCSCYDCLPYEHPIGCGVACDGDGQHGFGCECGCSKICPPVCFPSGCPGTPDGYCDDINDGLGDCTCGEYIASTVSVIAPTDRGAVILNKVNYPTLIGQDLTIGNRPHPGWGAEEDRLNSWQGWSAMRGSGQFQSYASCPHPDNTSGYSNSLQVDIGYYAHTGHAVPTSVAVTSSIHSNCLNAFDGDDHCINVCWGPSVFGSALYGTAYKMIPNCHTDTSCIGLPNYCDVTICACPCMCYPTMGGYLDGFASGGSCTGQASSEMCDCADAGCNDSFHTCDSIISYGAIPPVSGLIS